MMSKIIVVPPYNNRASLMRTNSKYKTREISKTVDSITVARAMVETLSKRISKSNNFPKSRWQTSRRTGRETGLLQHGNAVHPKNKSWAADLQDSFLRLWQGSCSPIHLCPSPSASTLNPMQTSAVRTFSSSTVAAKAAMAAKKTLHTIHAVVARLATP